MKQKDCATIAQVMKDGGYFDTIMQAGPELDRVKAYIRAFGGSESGSTDPLVYPDYPCFPGLHHSAWHAVEEVPGAVTLEQNFEAILAEWRELDAGDYVSYAPDAMRHTWDTHVLNYMGVNFATVTHRCPGTHTLLRSLPRVCLDYPWGDALISVHSRDSRLRPHCSVDNLRVRCHLGIQVPESCAIRVADETRTWETGRALVFEDSFEHEVWNRGEAERALLIVDFWNPDLTEIEIEALTAGFCKSQVRHLFAHYRLRMARSVPDAYSHHLNHQISVQDNEPNIKRYWPERVATDPRESLRQS